MSTDEANATTEADPVARLRSLRAELVTLLEALPETRLSKPTPRQGWTLRHELSWLAAADEELRRRLDLATSDAAEAPHWRRVRGEAMHQAQEMRLAALREHLANSGASVSDSLEAHAPRLDEPPIREAVEEHRRHTETALETLRTILAK